MKGIALVSLSKDREITFSLLVKIASALTRQQMEDYASVWQSQGVPVQAYPSLADVPDDMALSRILDTAAPDNILAYHDVTKGGRAFQNIYWPAIRDNGGSLFEGDHALSVTIAHEALELREDYGVNAWHDIGDGLTEDSRELCDRVEGDSYIIDGVSVSNFLGPRAFRPGVGPFDFLGIQGDPRGLTSAFEIRHNGYAIRRVGGPSGIVSTVFGASYPVHKMAAKLAQGSRAAQRGLRVPLPGAETAPDLDVNAERAPTEPAPARDAEA